MDRDSLQLLLAQGFSLDEIARRFGKHPSTVGYWVQKHGLQAVNKDRHAARGSIALEDLEALVAEGATVRRIAETLDRSPTTVRHWLRRYGLRTAAADHRTRTRTARAEGRLIQERECATHGLTDFRLEGRGYYRCLRCRAERVAQRRRKVKEILVREAGGACVICGYDRFMGALEFHHLDPGEKQFGLAMNGISRSLAAARREAGKCVLVCSNCHAEVEGGIATVPV